MNNLKRFILSFAIVITLGIAGGFLAFHGAAQAQNLPPADLGLNNNVQNAIGLPATDIRVIVARIIRAALGLLGTVALGLILYAGFRWMTAGGNEETIAEAKKILVNATIGLAIILSSFAITSFIINKLVEATTPGPGQGGGGGGGGGDNPYFPKGAFYISQLPAGGDVCIKNVHLLIIFNRNVALDQAFKDNVFVEKDADPGKAVAGLWTYAQNAHNVAEFVPSGACGDGTGDCFEANTKYTLKFKDGTKITAESNPNISLSCLLGAGCKNISFTTGDGVDRKPPTITFENPPPDDSIQQGALVPVKLHYTDDFGVQNVTLNADGFLVGSQSIGGCVKDGTATINWPTNGLPLGKHALKAVDYDWAAQTGEALENVTLKPSHCFNGLKDEDETGLDCGGTCGACGGDACTDNSQCGSGFCEIPQGKTQGVCVDKMRITEVSPLSGAAGTLVSVFGFYFGTTPGQVYFASTTNPGLSDWLEAPLVTNCGLGFTTWTPWQILVVAPGLANGLKGPIKVVTASTTVNGISRKFTDVTNDNWGSKIDDYEFTKQTRPGLCQAKPNSQVAGGKISLFGKNLSVYSNANQILFGATKASVNQFFTDKNNNVQLNWTDSLINEVTVPNLDPSTLGVKVVDKNGVDSNGVRFVVTSGISDDTPIISSITPQKGAGGQYITITGQHFGVTPNPTGVWFRENEQGPVLNGSFSFPKECGDSFWRDNQIIVKFDPRLGTPGATYAVQVNTAKNKTSLFDKNFTFKLENGSPVPGICKLDPVSGPLPLGRGQTLKAIGEYFSNNPEVYLWKLGASPTTTDNRALAILSGFFQQGGADVALTLPSAGSETGPVIVHQTGEPKDKISNPFNFTRWNCVQNNNVCTELNTHCCAAGGDTGLCKPNNELCEGETKSTAYIWRFSTKDIPELPRVIERCDQISERGDALPTPSPSALWDSALNNPDSGDHHNVCRSAVVMVEFSTIMDKNSISQAKNTVQVFKCAGGVEENNCANPQAVVLQNPQSFTLKSSFGGPGGQQRQYLEISQDRNAPWEDRAWYQIALIGGDNGIRSAGSVTSSFPLVATRPCALKNSAYCFVFKTDSQDCKLRQVIVTPYVYWTQILEAPIQYRVVGVPNGNLVYTGNGLSAQRCIMMDVSTYNWSWKSQNTDYAAMYPTDEIKGRSSLAAALGNTVGVGLLKPADAVNIVGTANNAVTALSGSSPLMIDLSKPKVLRYWPNCLEACTNAEIGAEFNISMAMANVNWNSVRLYRCLDENCLAAVATSTQAKPIFLAPTRVLLSIPHDELAPNALYKVSLSATSTPEKQLWSAGRLKDQTATSAPFAAEFNWRFRTKASACLIDRAAVAPPEFFAPRLTARSVYAVQPFSAPDSCSAAGQRLDPWKANWQWDSNDKKVAVANAFSTIGRNGDCSAICLKKGSDVAAGLGFNIPICGNNLVEAGEDCDGPEAVKQCGLDCRFMGNPDKGNKPKQCGDGVVDVDKGEACDPADPDTQVGCSADCRHLGSKLASGPQDINASICGNGFIGSGEDCDLGIPADSAIATSSLGCSAQCLHLGTRLSKIWCQKNSLKFAGFTENDYKAACAGAYSQCGDGIITDDEDAACEGLKGWDSKACDEFCLKKTDNKCQPGREGCDNNGRNAGSSLLYSTPSVCGDGITGIGEALECEQKLSQEHKGLVDPWALGIGVGVGTASGDPPAQRAIITAATNSQTKAGPVSGSGKFTIPCGYANDDECQVFNHDGIQYGVGRDTCCYARPKLLSTIPVNKDGDVCPNTYIEATFSAALDPTTFAQNVMIAQGFDKIPAVAPSVRHLGYLNQQKDGNVELNGASALAVSGTTAYVLATNASNLQIIDVTKPVDPVQIGRLYNNEQGAKLSSPVAIALSLSGKYAFITAGFGQDALEIVDVSDSKKPLHVAYIGDGDKGAKLKRPVAVAVDQNYAYVAAHDSNAVNIIDISNVVNNKIDPKPVAVIEDGFKKDGLTAHLNGPIGLALVNRYLYVISDGDPGTLQIIDVADRANPKPLGYISNGQGGAKLSQPASLVVTGNRAYALSNGSFQIIDITDKMRPFPEGYLLDNAGGGGARLKLLGPSQFAIVDRLAFIPGTDASTLEIVDIASSTAPRHLAYFAQDNDKSQQAKLTRLQAVVVKNDIAYMAAAFDSALEIADVSDFTTKYNPCPEDVTPLLMASNYGAKLQWYSRAWLAFSHFIKNIFGGNAEATIFAKPVRWCAGLDLGQADLLTDPATTTSRLRLTLNKPLETLTNYAIVFKDGLRDIRGVSIGTSTNPNAPGINWKFNTREVICEVNAVSIVPPKYNFFKAGTSTTLQALAVTQDRQIIQPFQGFYSWDYLWGPDNAFVSLTNTTTSRNAITSQNRNGAIDISASARITDNVYFVQTGLVGTGRSHINVFLCERPWPPQDHYYQGQGPVTVFPYEDMSGNNDGFDLASGTFSHAPIPPAATVPDGYFNFSTFFCADNGSPGPFDDLPYLKPAVQTTAAAMGGSNNGTCEITGNICAQAADCGRRLATSSQEFFIPFKAAGVCGAGAKFYKDSGGAALGCNQSADCEADPGFAAWAKKNNFTPLCATAGKLTALACQKHPPLKRFFLTNDQNSDVIGIQVFANPKHLSARDWYANSKTAGGQGFIGSVNSLTLSGYEAVSDGDNMYVNALNFSTSTQSLYSAMYLLSISQNALAPTRSVFEQLLRNLSFNANLTNYGFCGSSVHQPDFIIQCAHDLDCPRGQVCADQIDKLKRNVRRFDDFKQIDTALAAYEQSHGGKFPDLKAGTYLTGQTISTWPSWGTLGNALGVGLPADPINKLGLAGTCGTSTKAFKFFCTGNDPLEDITCPPVDGTAQSCVLHNSETGWSIENRRFSFACATSSYAYRYVFDADKGFQIRSNFEDTGLNIVNFYDFYDAYNLQHDQNFNFGYSELGGRVGICSQDQEISSFNAGQCGDGIVNWDAGEQCEPPGKIRYGSCQNDAIKIEVCTRPKQLNANDPGCRWTPSSTPNGLGTIACSALSQCGNGLKELGEKCDEGKLNSTYNHCNADCQGFGAAGYCGDNKLQNKEFGAGQNYELCEYSSLGANKTGWCGRNVFGLAVCDTDADCNNFNNHQTVAAVCFPYTNTKLRYGPLQKEASCNFDCQSYGPYCGDGLVQPGYGEECDGNPKDACTLGGVSGSHICAPNCRYADADAVGWWRLDDYDISLKDGQAAFYDSSPTGANGSCALNATCPDPQYTSGRYVFAFAPQAHSAIAIPHKPVLMSTTSFSVEAWIFPQSYDEPWQRVLEKGGWQVGGGYGLEFNLEDVKGIQKDAHKQRFIVWNAAGTASTAVDSDIDIPLEAWTHVVGTYQWSKNGDQVMKIYINGQLQGQRTDIVAEPFMAPNQSPLIIGKAGAPGEGRYFVGRIKEVKIYNRALQPAEVKDRADNDWVCHAKMSVPIAQAAPGTCGDGRVDPNTEACDQGLGNNGVACLTAYNKPCAYCSHDCKNVIEIQPAEYCGNGIIEANEKCDTSPVSGEIYVSKAEGEADPPRVVNNLLVPQFFGDNNGYKTLACKDEEYAFDLSKSQKFYKGTKKCVNNCSSLVVKENNNSTACVACGLDPKGALVNGGILNVLSFDSNDPLSVGLAEWGYLDIVSSDKKSKLAMFHASSVPNDQYSLSIINSNPLIPARLNTNGLCSTGEPRYQAQLQYAPQYNFDFPITDDPKNIQPGKYDLVLSPIIPKKYLVYDGKANIGASITDDFDGDGQRETIIQGSQSLADNIRIVVSWKGDRADFKGGFYIAKPGFESYESLPVQAGYDYFNKLGQVGIWHHGFGSTVGGTASQGFTIDTSLGGLNSQQGPASTKWPDDPAITQYAFYVKALAKGLKAYQNTPTNLKVDVYFPADDTVYNHFAKPTKTFYLNSAAPSDNAEARYWQVFAVLRNDFAWNLFHDPTHEQSVQAVVDRANNQKLENGRFVTNVDGFFK